MSGKLCDQFFFDFQSPYSFLAWERMKREITTRAADRVSERFKSLELKPVPMGSLIHSYETKGPAEIAPKRDFLMKSWLREVKRMNLNVALPKVLPFNSLYALRLSTQACLKAQISQEGKLEQKQWQLVDSLFVSAWIRGEDISDEQYLEQLLKENEINPNALEFTTSKEARKEIKLNLKTAQSIGAFGVPTWWLYGQENRAELFWGADCLEDVKNYIKGDDNYDHFLYQSYCEKFS